LKLFLIGILVVIACMRMSPGPVPRDLFWCFSQDSVDIAYPLLVASADIQELFTRDNLCKDLGTFPRFCK
jgi:hypothetical protein